MDAHDDNPLNSKSIKGTPNWMAPEIIHRTGHSMSADIWGFGCVIIELLTGKPPYPNLQINDVFVRLIQGSIN